MHTSHVSFTPRLIARFGATLKLNKKLGMDKECYKTQLAEIFSHWCRLIIVGLPKEIE